jgi:hypothetical protein
MRFAPRPPLAPPQWRSRVAAIVLVFTITLAAATQFAASGRGAATARHAADPPRIVPWHLIGNIGLGMSRSRVERMYGRGTVATPLRDAPAWVYRGRGAIRIEYDLGGDVAAVETASPAYASRSGIHVGRVLPPRLCGFVNYRCKHAWRGFTYDSDYRTWERASKVGRFVRYGVDLELGARAAVRRIALTRYLQCPRGEYEIRNACREPPPGQDFRFYFPAPAGLRFCEVPGGPGNFLAASPAVPCRVAADVESKISACIEKTRCKVDGFRCIAEWAGRYNQPFSYTHHAICVRDANNRVVWDGG